MDGLCLGSQPFLFSDMQLVIQIQREKFSKKFIQANAVDLFVITIVILIVTTKTS